MTLAAPHSLAFVRIGVADLDEAIAFYTYHVGLDVSGVGENHALMRSGLAHHSIQLVRGSNYVQAEVLAVGYTVATSDEMGEIEAQVRSKHESVAKISDITAGYVTHGFATSDPNGLTVELVYEFQQFAERNRRPESPVEVLHPFLLTNRLEETEEYYSQVLGFRFSDFIGQDAAFLRTGSRRHHSLALQRGDHFRVGHICFLMPSFDEVMRARSRALYKGVEIPFDLAKHPGSGSSGFYLFDPRFGPRIELCHDHYQLTAEEHDQWTPRRLAPDARSVDAWRTEPDDWGRM